MRINRGSGIIIALLRHLKIRSRIMVYLLISLFVFSISILLFSRTYTRILINRYIYDYVKSAQQQIVTSIELTTNEVIMLFVRLQGNQQIYDTVKDTALTHEQKLKQLKGLLDSFVGSKDTVGDILFVTSDGENFDYRGLIADLPSAGYLKQIEATNTPVWGSVIKDNINNKAYIPFGVKFSNFFTGQKLGYMIIYINENALYNIYKEIVPDWGYSFLVTKNNYILSHPDKNKIGYMILDSEAQLTNNKVFSAVTENYEGKQSVVASLDLGQRMKSLGADWKIISVISYSKLFSVIEKINMYLLTIGIIMVLTTIFVSVTMSRRIINSLERLKKKLNAFGRGNLQVTLEENIQDEIWELEKSYNSMIVRINDLIENIKAEKEKQRELELIALQAQINPHFLYNTLDAIACIAKLKNRQDDIELIVMELARFFRLSLHKGDKYITVEEEIQLVQSFVTIEQMRCPDKFDVEYHIPEEILHLKMLKITLQPLVENAIKHGIRQKRGKGHILVHGMRFGDELKFQVIDDGVGFDVEKTNLKKTSYSMSQSGYGLYNVDERIKLEYGARYGLRIDSEINKGTTVEVDFNIIV